MNEMHAIVNGTTRVTFLLMSALLFGYALLPDYRAETLGMTLGLAAGLINVRYLSMKVAQVSEIATQSNKKRVSLGFVTRLCIGLLVVMFAVKFEQVSLVFTIIGLFMAQLLVLVVALVLSLKNKH